MGGARRWFGSFLAGDGEGKGQGEIEACEIGVLKGFSVGGEGGVEFLEWFWLRNRMDTVIMALEIYILDPTYEPLVVKYELEGVEDIGNRVEEV